MNLNKKYFLVLLIFFIFFAGILIGFRISNKNLPKQNQPFQNQFVENKFAQAPLSSNELPQNPQINQSYKAKVAKVLDGDTIELENGKRVRYIGINTPEIGEPFSILAKKENENLVLNKEVVLEFDVQIYDKYNRLLAYVWSDNILINQKLVLAGLATIETIPPNVKYVDLFLESQKKAQNNCLNLWEDLCKKNEKTSCIKISNIFANAPGDDNQNKNGEWIEIKNTCDKELNLANWMIKDLSASNRYFFKNFYLGANKSVKIYSGCGKDDAEKLYWQCPEGKYAIWNNSGDEAFLYDSNKNLVDYYKY